MHKILEDLMHSITLKGNIKDDMYNFLKHNNCLKTAEHSLRVGEEARRIAHLFNIDADKAETAGLLHDISAVFPNSERIFAAQQLGIEILPEENTFPMIIHQKISAVIAKELFGIEDILISNAIGCHTTLRAESTELDQLLFVADKIEWDQTGIPPYLNQITEKLKLSLQHAAFEYIRYLWLQKESLRVVHPWLVEAYHDLKEQLSVFKQTKQIEVNDGELYCEIAGNGETLVLIHGIGLDTRVWDNQFDEFARSFRVIRYDLRGFGQSTLPTNTFYSHEQDLLTVMDTLGIHEAHFVGLSMGGSVAINFALQFPNRTKSLMLINSGLGGFTPKKFDQDLMDIYDKIEKRVKDNELDLARDLWLSLPHFTPLQRSKKHKLNIVKMTESYSFWHFANKNPLIRPETPAITRLKSISHPCLIAVGELDLQDFHDISNILKEEIAQSVKYVIPDSGHILNMEQSDVFNELVLQFISNLV